MLPVSTVASPLTRQPKRVPPQSFKSVAMSVDPTYVDNVTGVTSFRQTMKSEFVRGAMVSIAEYVMRWTNARAAQKLSVETAPHS